MVEVENNWLGVQNTERSKKSQALGMTKERETARWKVVARDKACFTTFSPGSPTLSFVIPSAAEGSAVPRTSPGNAF
ncbi:MAG: hypothetical protein QOJ42_7312 [Acidobacteriaceae bacterium]|nr:hypothetical protein [Acidobacteriaceae bacterium]